MKVRVFFILVFAGLYCFTYSQYQEKEIRKGLRLISERNINRMVKYFSSYKCYGRQSGSEGYDRASEYVKNKFIKWGLKPLNGSYEQFFNIEYNNIKNGCKFYIINKYKEYKLKIGDDYIFRGMTGSGDIKSEVVFCGYGITRKDLGYDDYEGVDVKDKIVIVFRQNPGWKIKDSSWNIDYARQKALIAYEHGAKAIIFVNKFEESNKKAIGSVFEPQSIAQVNIPQIHINYPAVNKFFENSGYDLKKLQNIIDSTKKSYSVFLGKEALIKVETEYYKEKRTQNIVGIIEGNDSIKKDEFIILGAHLDHVGGQAGKIYFAGANDNASGSATVMEVAKAFGKGKIKSDRTIIFVLFAGEENYMLGSEYFVEHMPISKEKILCMINFDCVGQGDSALVRCGKLFPDLWNVAKTMNDKYVDMMSMETTNTSYADASSFYKRGIPTLYFIAKNTYKYLHLIEDKPKTLNKKVHKKLTEIAFLTTYKLSMDERNNYR